LSAGVETPNSLKATHNPGLEHFLKLFMSGKKHHEVVRMGYSVKAAADKMGVKTLLGMIRLV
jgi:hypothetical protein